MDAVGSGDSEIVVYGSGDIVFGAKGHTSGHSGIVVYGGGDIVFGAKRSSQWTQWMQWNSGIWWWGQCLWCKKFKPVDTVESWYMVVGILSWYKKIKPVDTVDAVE